MFLVYWHFLPEHSIYFLLAILAFSMLPFAGLHLRLCQALVQGPIEDSPVVFHFVDPSQSCLGSFHLEELGAAVFH